jgi:hypothetical protein
MLRQKIVIKVWTFFFFLLFRLNKRIQQDSLDRMGIELSIRAIKHVKK